MKTQKYLLIGIVFFFVLLFSLPVLGQEDDKGSLFQHRYWHYRGRVKNDFMLGTGAEPGESFVFGGRCCGILYTGENPAEELGKYIGVLAMEYYLLKKNNQDYYETLKDLYYSLYAINRLDIQSGEYQWYGDIGHSICFFNKKTGDSTIQQNLAKQGQCSSFTKNTEEKVSDGLNGFFIRDDIYSIDENGESIRYKLDYEPFSSDPSLTNQYDRLTSSNSIEPIKEDKISSLFMKHKEQYLAGNCSGDKYEKIEESQDEVVHYLYGLALVIKYLDEDITFNNKVFQDGETSLKLEARAIASRMINWFAHCPPGYICTSPDWFFAIINPNTDKYVNNGCYALGMSWGFYKAALAMGIELDDIDPNSPKATAWRDVWEIDPFLSAKTYGHKMYCILGSIGDSWSIALNPDRTMDILESQYFYEDDRDIKFDSFILYHCVLHGMYYDEHVKDKLGYYQDILRNAPISLMESNYIDGNTFKFIPAESFEWSGGSRDLIPRDRGLLSWNFNNHHVYSGLDYMFLMNMFFIAYGDVLNLKLSNLANTVAYADHNFIQKDYPDEGIGSYEHPKVLKGFNEVSSNKTIDSDGNVSFIAQNKIVLKPGFKALKGSSFKAFLDPVENHYYNCIPPIPTPESEIYVSTTKVDFKKINEYKYKLTFNYVKDATDAYSYLIAKIKKEGKWIWSIIAQGKGSFSNLAPKVVFILKDKGKNETKNKFYTYTSFYKAGEMTHKPILLNFGQDLPPPPPSIVVNSVPEEFDGICLYYGVKNADDMYTTIKDKNGNIVSEGNGIVINNSDKSHYCCGSVNLTVGETYDVKTVFSNSFESKTVNHSATYYGKSFLKSGGMDSNEDNLLGQEPFNNFDNAIIGISFYPNPCHDNFTIYFIGNSIEKKTLFIYNSFGVLVYQKVLSLASENINVGFLSSGIYQAKIVVGEKQFNRKLIIQ